MTNKTGLETLVEWWETVKDVPCDNYRASMKIMNKARSLLAQEQAEFAKRCHHDLEMAKALDLEERVKREQAEQKPVEDAQKRYYNECAKNYVLYNLAADLSSELEKWDPNHKILERAEDELSETFHPGNMRPEGSHRPVESLAELAKRKGVPGGIAICIPKDHDYLNDEIFDNEAAASAYLNQLPDKSDSK